MACSFLVTDYQQVWTQDVLHIHVVTDVPVNLTLRWTDQQTWTHLREDVKRGLALLKEPYYCFVEWQFIPQIQPRDTLLHDFLFPGWQVGDCFYWHFVGTELGIDCISSTSLFTDCFNYEGQDPPFPPEPERIELLAYPTTVVQNPVTIQPSTSGKIVTSFGTVVS